MEHYVVLDVSLKLTAICIVDRTGKIVRVRSGDDRRIHRQGTGCNCILTSHQHAGTKRDLRRLGFVAEPRSHIRYRSNVGVIEASLEADGAERGKSVRDAEATCGLSVNASLSDYEAWYLRRRP
jgi:hypothetical protein